MWVSAGRPRLLEFSVRTGVRPFSRVTCRFRSAGNSPRRHNAEAIAELQKILDHRGIVGVDPIGALAHLQLGRVFAFSGDKTKAKAAYQDFLALWKDADPDIPLLQQAKAEFARL
jgi:hypothetical protein